MNTIYVLERKKKKKKKATKKKKKQQQQKNNNYILQFLSFSLINIFKPLTLQDVSVFFRLLYIFFVIRYVVVLTNNSLT